MQAFDFNEDYHFENERARIRPLAMTDLEYLLPIALSDEKLLAYSPSQIHTEDYLKQYLETALKARADKFRYPFLIFDKQTNEYAGSTSFGNVSNVNSRLEIGWTWIGPKFQGSGLNRS